MKTQTYFLIWNVVGLVLYCHLRSAARREGEGARRMPDAARARRRLTNIVGGSAGNLVEWFDWYVYSAFALYFAPSFLPEGRPDRAAAVRPRRCSRSASSCGRSAPG